PFTEIAPPDIHPLSLHDALPIYFRFRANFDPIWTRSALCRFVSTHMRKIAFQMRIGRKAEITGLARTGSRRAAHFMRQAETIGLPRSPARGFEAYHEIRLALVPSAPELPAVPRRNGLSRSSSAQAR